MGATVGDRVELQPKSVHAQGRSGTVEEVPVGVTVPLPSALGRRQMEHHLSDRRLPARRVTQQTNSTPSPNHRAAEEELTI